MSDDERIARAVKAIVDLREYVDGGFVGGAMAERIARAVLDQPPTVDLASPAARAEALSSWPPGVPGVKPEPRSARVATVLDAPDVAFIVGGDSDAHLDLSVPPVGVRLVISITWQEALNLASSRAFSGATMDEILLRLLAVDADRFVQVRKPPG